MDPGLVTLLYVFGLLAVWWVIDNDDDGGTYA